MAAAQSALDDSEYPLKGKIHFLRKQMRLKTGKEYFEAFFPGYLFFETEEVDPKKLIKLAGFAGFLRFLPSSTEINPLSRKDLNIVTSLLQFGSTIGIVPVSFDENDRIIIQDGPFKNISGKVIAVNRRNKRVNIELDFMNGIKVIGLSYEEVNKNRGI